MTILYHNHNEYSRRPTSIGATYCEEIRQSSRIGIVAISRQEQGCCKEVVAHTNIQVE